MRPSTFKHYFFRGYCVASLGANVFYKLRLFVLFWLFVAKRKLHLGTNISDTKVKLKKFNQKFSIYLGCESDLNTLHEVFIEDEYDISLKKEPGVIFDLGSNIGLSVIYFKLKYPRARIYAFEPDPDTFLKLERNTLQFGDIICYKYAVSGHDDVRKFYSSPRNISSSLVFRKEVESRAIKVETRSLASLIEELKTDKVDLLKFDVEGAEFEIFANGCPTGIANLIGEVHYRLLPGDRQSFFGLFRGYDIKLKNSRSEIKQIVTFQK